MPDLKQRIAAANEVALKRLLDARPFLIDMAQASDVVPGMRPLRLHHAGPPVTPARMCGAQRGAAVCAILTEGWARSPQVAFSLLDAGEIALGANHDHASVGPMAGIVSPTTWMWVVEDRTHGKVAFAPDQMSRTIFGAYDEEVALAQRRFSRDVAGPAIRAALRHTGPIDLGLLMAQSLHMGDELHNRQDASSALIFRALAPGLMRVGGAQALATMEYIASQQWFFLPLAMAAGKVMADAAHGVAASTVVTAMCRNGTEFGLRVSGLGERWFTGPAQRVKGLYLPGFTEADAGLDLGDSAITETIGLGGFVLAAGAALLPYVGGTVAEVMDYLPLMRSITVGQDPRFTVPILDFAPAPAGIDIRKVVATGTLPIIDTAIAHRDAGHQILGAGMVHPPSICFDEALRGFGQVYLDTPASKEV